MTQPLRSDVPALLVSGGMDPVTPPAYGTLVARDLPNSRHIIAPGYGHIVTPHACGPRLMAAFVDTADPAKLPQSYRGIPLHLVAADALRFRPKLVLEAD